jgi:uncharacterized small protein (DUF1192 family)
MREQKMDFDEPQNTGDSGAASLATESLDDLSVFELEERVSLLKAEIVRTELAIERKQSGQSEAEKFFH